MTRKNVNFRYIIPVLLAGGSGSRLWPLSRTNYPKALLALKDNNSLLQNILSQIKLIPFFSTPIVVGNVNYGNVISEQIKNINSKATVLLEPEACNTAMASAIAAHYTLTLEDDPLLLILPIDNVITTLEQFANMLKIATKIALDGNLVIFGVKPNYASTEYGYIKKGIKYLNSPGFKVKQFVEKPDIKKATTYLRSDNYYWNSGIFLFLASTFLEELALYSPKIYLRSKKSISKIKLADKNLLIHSGVMKDCPSISIDKAIFEKTKHAIVLPFRGGWSEIGNWNSLYDLAKKDKQGNVATENVETFNTKNCYLYSTKQILVTSGIKNLLVVVTKDAILVASRDDINSIKNIVSYLIRKKYKEAILSPTVYRSWGSYELIEKNKSYQIKHYFIYSNKVFTPEIKLHDSTCWIIVDGRGQVTAGTKVKTISKNDFLKINNHTKFQVKNVSHKPLHFIEVCYMNLYQE